MLQCVIFLHRNENHLQIRGSEQIETRSSGIVDHGFQGRPHHFRILVAFLNFEA